MLEVSLEALEQYAVEQFCYLTTIGRVSGKPHRIEIWFALHDRTLYILAGSGTNSDWVKNSLRNPHVRVEIGGRAFVGVARLVERPEEDALARQLVVGKYAPTEDDLDEWGRTALPVAVDLQESDAASP